MSFIGISCFPCMQNGWPNFQSRRTTGTSRKAFEDRFQCQRPMQCVVCTEVIEQNAFTCTCEIHWVHRGACLDHWIRTQLGVDSVLLLANDWSRMRGCPVCSDAPLFGMDRLCSTLFPALTHPSLVTVLSAVTQRAAITSQAEVPDADDDAIARIANSISDVYILRCPSCGVGFHLDPERGCDAAWCENPSCRRAFCLWCLQDCGDHAKSDPSAASSALKGDAHAHVKGNDCCLTGGVLFSGDKVANHHLKRQRQEVARRLKRLDTDVQQAVCARLGIDSGSESALPSDPNARDCPSDVLQARRKFLMASWSGSLELVQSYLSAGVDPLTVDETPPRLNALHFAAAKGNTSVVTCLLASKVDPHLRDMNGRTALHHAVNAIDAAPVPPKKRLETVRTLVEACLLSPRLDGRGEVPWTAKMNGGSSVLDSVRRQHSGTEVEKYFQRMGERGVRLLHAAFQGDTDQVETLLHTSEKELVHVHDANNGATALHFASKAGSAETVSILLGAGAAVHRRDVHRGRTALHYLAMEQSPSLEVARQLLLAGGEDLKRAVDWDHKTAVHYAVDLGSPDMVKLLLSATEQTVSV
eukprot:TRINITY_DN19681_c0_g5_i1.p1 TRINITY_DN19681_c0_g5~~TRINITY_DN19681_c0_g5_i1.p1  ORF type:complete len:585 (+),score=56.34 TRINITY_DN19681_c0_g5_i1:56-1810(+)